MCRWKHSRHRCGHDFAAFAARLADTLHRQLKVKIVGDRPVNQGVELGIVERGPPACKLFRRRQLGKCRLSGRTRRRFAELAWHDRVGGLVVRAHHATRFDRRPGHAAEQ